MSEQGKAPTAAELREAASWCEGEPMQAKLLAGADAMDSLAAMRAQRDRLAILTADCRDLLRAILTSPVKDQNLRDQIKRIDTALAEMEGGAS